MAEPKILNLKGYSELNLKQGLYPLQLKSGITAKQIEALQQGFLPKHLFTGLQPTKRVQVK